MNDRSNRSENISPLAAYLCLLAALKWSADHERPTQWSPKTWRRVVGNLDPVEVAIVAMYGIRGMGSNTVGAWLGVTGSSVRQRWKRIAAALREVVTDGIV